MTADYTKVQLSGGNNGRNIKVAATSTPGTLIHTATAAASTLDELFLDAINSSALAVKITIELGGVTDPDDLIEFTVPPEDGPYSLVRGYVLDNGILVRAFAGTTNVIMINGFVNRIVGA